MHEPAQLPLLDSLITAGYFKAPALAWLSNQNNGRVMGQHQPMHTEEGVPVIKPFHLSFAVPDLKEAADFYINVLGSEIGRDTGAWIDIIFFGHQLTLHQNRDGEPSKSIDHFGPVLSKVEWLEISKKIASNGIAFLTPPTVNSEGSNSESGKYTIKDPAGNTLEFKYYANFSTQVARRSQ